MKNFFVIYFGCAMEMVKRRILISNVSAGNITQCREQHVAQELQIERVCHMPWIAVPHHSMTRSQVAYGWLAFRSRAYLRIYRMSSRVQVTRGGPWTWGLGEVLIASHYKNSDDVTKYFSRRRTGNDLASGMWGACIGQGHDSGHGISDVQIRFDGCTGGAARAGDYSFFNGKEMKNRQFGTR